MKKYTTLLLLFITIFTLSACGDDNQIIENSVDNSINKSAVNNNNNDDNEIQSKQDDAKLNNDVDTVSKEEPTQALSSETISPTPTPSESEIVPVIDFNEKGKEITDSLTAFEWVLLSKRASFDNTMKGVLLASASTEKTLLGTNDCLNIYPGYDEYFDSIYQISEDDLNKLIDDYLGNNTRITVSNGFTSNEPTYIAKYKDNFYIYMCAGDSEYDYQVVTSSAEETDSGFQYIKDVFFGYYENDHSVPTNRITYTLFKSNRSAFGYYITDVNVTSFDSASVSSVNKTSGINEPFYGIWVSAYTNEDDANKMAADVPNGIVVLSTDWENLNSKPYYCVTSGAYLSKEDANAACDDIKALYPSAYVKYSGAKK